MLGTGFRTGLWLRCVLCSPLRRHYVTYCDHYLIFGVEYIGVAGVPPRVEGHLLAPPPPHARHRPVDQPHSQRRLGDAHVDAHLALEDVVDVDDDGDVEREAVESVAQEARRHDQLVREVRRQRGDVDGGGRVAGAVVDGRRPPDARLPGEQRRAVGHARRDVQREGRAAREGERLVEERRGGGGGEHGAAAADVGDGEGERARRPADVAAGGDARRVQPVRVVPVRHDERGTERRHDARRRRVVAVRRLGAVPSRRAVAELDRDARVRRQRRERDGETLRLVGRGDDPVVEHDEADDLTSHDELGARRRRVERVGGRHPRLVHADLDTREERSDQVQTHDKREE